MRQEINLSLEDFKALLDHADMSGSTVSRLKSISMSRKVYQRHQKKYGISLPDGRKTRHF